jgi:hypothetical protein
MHLLAHMYAPRCRHAPGRELEWIAWNLCLSIYTGSEEGLTAKKEDKKSRLGICVLLFFIAVKSSRENLEVNALLS